MRIVIVFWGLKGTGCVEYRALSGPFFFCKKSARSGEDRASGTGSGSVADERASFPGGPCDGDPNCGRDTEYYHALYYEQPDRHLDPT